MVDASFDVERSKKIIKMLVRVITDIHRDTVTPDTAAIAGFLLDLYPDTDFLQVLAGANLDNIQEARELALEELELLL